MSELFKIHNVLSIGLGVAGLVFGIYSYFASQPKYEISYSVRTKPVAELSGYNLNVYDQEAKVAIDDDICRTDLSFWVTGNAVIEDKVIRRPISIVLPDNARIIRKDIRARLGTSEISLQKSKIGFDLKFGYLDPGAGARILFLTNCFSQPVSMSGSSVGDLSVTKQVSTNRSLWIFVVLYPLLVLMLLRPVIKLSDSIDVLIERKMSGGWLSGTSKLTSFALLMVLTLGVIGYVCYNLDQAVLNPQVPTTIAISE